MAGRLRLNRAGLWYHVTARGNERKPIYRDDRDRRHFIELFVDGVSSCACACTDRRGDWGRELALYLGREKGGMRLRESTEAVGARNLMAINLAIGRFRLRLTREKSFNAPRDPNALR